MLGLYLESVTGSEHKLNMVIYGIDNIESFESPRLQLSLAILMKRKLDWVLEALKCHVLSVNEQGMRKVVNPILFFMPHCEAELYDNIPKTNWKHDSLNKIILFGNNFEKYEQHHSVVRGSMLDESRKHLLAIRPFMKEWATKGMKLGCFKDGLMPGLLNRGADTWFTSGSGHGTTLPSSGRGSSRFVVFREVLF
uniref:SRR1-like domain-containing protein n=1 Tax=Helianthus annuus TaxID=4232 RepID=A0A251UHT5_HELAN